MRAPLPRHPRLPGRLMRGVLAGCLLALAACADDGGYAHRSHPYAYGSGSGGYSGP